MEKDKVNMFVMQHNKHFSSHDMMIVCQKLEDMSENNFMRIATLVFKSPTTTLVLAWFLGGLGIDAFYTKKTGFGIAKLLTYIVYMIGYMIGYIKLISTSEFDFIVGASFAVAGIALIVMIILYIVGIVNARKWTQEYNFNHFMETVQML